MARIEIVEIEPVHERLFDMRVVQRAATRGRLPVDRDRRLRELRLTVLIDPCDVDDVRMALIEMATREAAARRLHIDRMELRQLVLRMRFREAVAKFKDGTPATLLTGLALA